jgi:hypothetical protein
MQACNHVYLPDRNSASPLSLMKPGLLFLAISPFPLALQAWQQPSSLDQVLPRVQENVTQFEASLPNFVCNERITSSKISDGKVAAETVIESIFVSIQKRDQPGRHLHYVENRELTTVNGKNAAKDQKLPKGPFILRGGFSGTLSTVFDPLMAAHRNYSLGSAEPVDGKTMLVIEFFTKEGQKEIGMDLNGKWFPQKDSGKAWIDPDSMQVARLEYRVANAPSSFSQWSFSVEYASVLIGGQPFWMPKTVRSEISRPPSGKRSDEKARRFVAEYTNYRKFDVSSGVVY